MCGVAVGELEITLRTADRLWQEVQWGPGSARERVLLRGNTMAALRGPICLGLAFPRMELNGEGCCEQRRWTRSLGVRLLKMARGERTLCG
jgi:hypothetical protein